MATRDRKSAKVARFEECYKRGDRVRTNPARCKRTIRNFKEIQNQRKPLYFVHYESEKTFFSSVEISKTEILGDCVRGGGWEFNL